MTLSFFNLFSLVRSSSIRPSICPPILPSISVFILTFILPSDHHFIRPSTVRTSIRSFFPSSFNLFLQRPSFFLLFVGSFFCSRSFFSVSNRVRNVDIVLQ